jgi:Mn2+/Fe2+ NRAMP family transporter
MATATDDLAKIQSTSAEIPAAAGLAGKLHAVVMALGPGLVTGASDDDPSGIATYSQVGAQFGYGMLWTMLLTYPLMAAIQEVSARIGRVTGCGISANLRRCYPRWLLMVAYRQRFQSWCGHRGDGCSGSAPAAR